MTDDEIPALGRHFILGTLYDWRRDKIIHGKSLLSRRRKKTVKKIPKNSIVEYEAVKEDTTKIDKLGTGPNLKLSLIGKTFDNGWGVKYICDTKPSAHHVRVTLKCCYDTHFESMTINEIDNSEITEDTTHIVSGIYYGFEAYFVFDRSVTSNENIHEIKANVDLALNSVLATEASLHFDKTNSNKKETSNLKVKVYGDIIPDYPKPTSYEEVKEFRKHLTTCKDASSFPRRITLLPVYTLLKQRRPILFRTVSDPMTNNIEQVVERMIETESMCKDLKKIDACAAFSDRDQHISKLLQLIQGRRQKFQRDLCRLLPQVRTHSQNEDEDEKEKKLKELIDEVEISLFNHEKLKEYIKLNQRVLHILDQHKKNLTMDYIKEAYSNRKSILHKAIADKNNTHVFCFTFNISVDTTYTEFMEKNSTQAMPTTKQRIENQKYTLVREKIVAFLALAKANTKKTGVVFVATDKIDKPDEIYGLTGPSIIHYDNESGCKKIFDPPMPYDLKITEKSPTSVNIEWSIPEKSSFYAYDVLYTRSDKEHTEDWGEKKTKKKKFIISGLDENVEYTFQIQGVCQNGINCRSLVCRYTTVSTTSNGLCNTKLLLYLLLIVFVIIVLLIFLIYCWNNSSYTPSPSPI